MSVDARLLNRNSYSDSDFDYEEEGSAKSFAGGESYSLREQVFSEKIKKKKEEKSKLKKSLAISRVNPIKKWSAGFLKSSWLNIIPSFGFSIFGVFGIAFLRIVFGKKLIVRLGDEFGLPGVNNLSEKRKTLKNTVEPMGVAFIAALLIITIIVTVGLTAMIVGFVLNPLKAIVDVLSETFKSWLNL